MATIATPHIIRESSSGYSTVSILDDMLQNREVECVGEITDESVYSLCRQLRYLHRLDPKKEITMFINSPGGSVTDGLALYDVMKGIACPVRTVCLGTAASMAAVLFASGAQREILPHGKVMIALQLMETSKSLMATREHLASILSEHTGHSLEEIYEKTARDTYFDAEEAVAFGLADRVITQI